MVNTSKQRVYNWYISLVAASCMVLYGYDAAVFNAVQGSKNWVNYYGNPDPNRIGAVNTASTVSGIVVGWFLTAPLSDYFGRRVAMFCGAFVVFFSTFIQAFAPAGHGIGAFIAGRALVGAGQALAIPAGPVYIGELAPPDIRGKIMSFWQLFFSVGSFIAYWVNYACTKNVPKLGNWDWRMVVIFQLLFPSIICALIFFCPETPRWYVQKGRIEDARNSLRKVRETEEEVETELLQIKQAIEYEKHVIDGRYAPLWKDRSIRKRLLLAFVLNFGQQVTGQGSLNSYSTIVYKKVFKDNSTIQLINALNGTFGIIFTLNATWTADRYGRKFLLWLGALGMAICMICSASVYVGTPDNADGSKTTGVASAIVFLMFLFAFFYKPSWGAAVWIWSSEVFSMNVRSQAVAMSAQMQGVGNAIVNQIFPLILAKIGFKAMYMFAGINLLLAAFVWFFLPETKGYALEEMDTLFGGVNHTEKGAQFVENEVVGEILSNHGTELTTQQAVQTSTRQSV
ncbi:hypothetical protein TWF694_005226 [Orbilia ellipsospora]|uniref:Major facilitator superfamily (MFS) profile domain-containing protein n=1 Tax=Orbilia ellipsospora TaxID=2528407 RepID=A0AAV9WW19_9PEZI